MKSRFATYCSRRERGSITFFVAALMLPALFLLFSLSLDVGKYYAEMDAAQKTLDDAALFAWRYLPYAAEAESAARDYLDKSGYQGARIQAHNEKIAIRYETLSQISFTKLLGVTVEIPLPVFSEAVGTPFDVSLIVDSSGYLAPDVYGSSPWGSETADFFSSIYPRYHNGQPLNPRVVTEQCFNPLFTALKRSAIGIYDYISASRLNAVGISFSPGQSFMVDTARPVVPAGPLSNGAGEAVMSLLNNTGIVGDELCAAAVQEQSWGDPRPFQLPDYAAPLNRQWSPSPGSELKMIEPDGWHFDPLYQPYLQAREVIWSRAVHHGAESSFDAVLSRFATDLIGAAILNERGGVALKARKSAVMLTADVPRIGGQRFSNADDAVAQSIRTYLEQIVQSLVAYKQDLRLYYLVYHNNLAFSDADLGPRITELRSFFSELEDGLAVSGRKHLELKVLDASDPDLLARGVMSSLVLDARNAMLSR